MDVENNLREFCIDNAFLQSDYKLLLNIAENYSMILDSFFEFPEEIPEYEIHFTLNGIFNEWDELFSTKIATIKKGSNSVVVWSHEKPGIKLNGIKCQFNGGDGKIFAFFDIPLMNESILFNITRHFFSEIMKCMP